LETEDPVERKRRLRKKIKKFKKIKIKKRPKLIEEEKLLSDELPNAHKIKIVNLDRAESAPRNKYSDLGVNNEI
jgi:hypothetical protein